MLMTFADNALPPDEMAAIERYLATDADARALVAAFRRSREAVRAAIPIEAFERSDDPLANAILSGELGGRMATNAERLDHRSPIEATAGEDTRADVLRLPRHRPAPANESRSPILVSRQWALPLAASIALVIGGFVGYGLRGTSNLDKIADGSKVAPEIGIGTLPGSSPIARFLERATTGETLALTNRDGSTGSTKDDAHRVDRVIL